MCERECVCPFVCVSVWSVSVCKWVCEWVCLCVSLGFGMWVYDCVSVCCMCVCVLLRMCSLRVVGGLVDVFACACLCAYWDRILWVFREDCSYFDEIAPLLALTGVFLILAVSFTFRVRHLPIINVSKCFQGLAWLWVYGFGFVFGWTEICKIFEFVRFDFENWYGHVSNSNFRVVVSDKVYCRWVAEGFPLQCSGLNFLHNSLFRHHSLFCLHDSCCIRFLRIDRTCDSPSKMPKVPSVRHHDHHSC